MSHATKMIQAPKGTQDLLPKDLTTWQFVEQTTKTVFERNNFLEIRTPIFESTDLFERGVGESTDIVNKEMYTFEKSDRSLTLRPESTAGVVRAYIQHGMDRWPTPVKLYYMGPMFRYERPQAGRQRQFHQIGVELFGLDTPQSDAAVILLAMELFTALDVPQLALEINNVGCFDCRSQFRESLKSLLFQHLEILCEDCQRRFHTNPLRMLDCKNPTCKALYATPEISDFLAQDHTCEACQNHYQTLLGILTACNVPYHHNKMLVRGLDYYTRTVFEITSTHLGAQNTVCGGGRYNGLVKTLGGPDTPAIGWALGVERLVSLMVPSETKPLNFYVVSDDPAQGLILSRDIQAQGFSVEVDLSGKAMKKQLERANKLGAEQVVILGESERQENQVTLKQMATGTQQILARSAFFNLLSQHRC
jgi:histidyl-tRNA synthetase